MNLIRKFMDSGVKSELALIASGQFDLLRSKSSPKASLECIYNDATLSLREKGQYSYVLVVKKNADELEVSNGDGSDEFSDDSVSALSVQSKKKEDEWVFELSEETGFHRKWNKQGDVAFLWNNTLGDEEDEKVQFVVASDVQMGDVDKFMLTAQRCEYEVKYKESSSNATRDDLEKIATRAALLSGDVDYESVPSNSQGGHDLADNLRSFRLEDSNDSDSSEFEDARDTVQGSKSPEREIRSAPKGKQLCLLKCSLSIFDPKMETFVLQNDDVLAGVFETGDYEYWLAIEGDELRMGTDVSPNIDPITDTQRSAFIFNYAFSSITLSYMLSFTTKADCLAFQSTISKCLWLTLNRTPWEKVSQQDKQYIVNSATAVEKELDEILEDDSGQSQSEEEFSDESDDDEHSKIMVSSESFGDSHEKRTRSEGNRSLTVAFKNDRSYVVRGDKIGVFKTDSDGLDFVTAIRNVTDLSGKRLDPQNPMLYMEDQAMVLRDGTNGNKLYKMDLERGKVIEEWEAGGKNVVQVGPTKKFDQLTPEQTLLGVSNKGLFMLDPRLNKKDKVVQDQSKEYATNYKFSSLGTTENGYIAVGSEKGDIRLYDRLGIRAKTAIPSLGQPIKHITTSSDGRWLLCTCESSLLLFDLTVKTGKNAGNIGFLKSFPGTENAKTYILKISPEHASYIATSTKKPIKFSKAYFNTGIGKEEQTIVTSSGPFAVSWSLKKVLKGNKKPYVMKKYDADIIEDNFEFGTDRKVIVALENDVSMSKIRSFKSPDKQIMAPNLSLFYNSDDDDERAPTQK